MSVTQIPGDIITRIAIRDVEEDAKLARGPLGSAAVYSLRERERLYKSILATVVLDGSALEEARGWAMRVAMVRDCQPTFAEREAVAS